MLMMNVERLLSTVEEEMRGNYEPPGLLLRKMDPQVPLDREYLGYVKNGGMGGGYYRWLALLTRVMRPRRILELGNRYGVSTIMIYSELPQDSQLISVDILHDQRYVPEEMWQDPRVRFVFGDCLDLTIYGGDIPIDVDVFWTDTVHFYEQVRDEFDVYEPLLADEALIIVDDIWVNDKGRFFEEAPYTKYDLTALCHGSGFGVLHYVRDPSRRCIQEVRLREAALASARVWKRRFDTVQAELHSSHAELRALQPEVERLKRYLVPPRLRRYLRPLRPVYGPMLSWLRSRKA